MDILTIYDKLIDNLAEIALLMNRKIEKRLDEDLSEDLSELVKSSLSLIELADKRSNDLTKEDVGEINERFDNLMDTISLVIAVYNKSGKDDLSSKLYKDLITNLEALGKKNWELEQTYKMGLHQLKFSLEKGKKLLSESFDKLLSDIDFSFMG